MKMPILCFACAAFVLILNPLRAQPLSSRSRFEVATVKPATTDQSDSVGTAFLFQFVHDNLKLGEIPVTSPGRIHLQQWTLRDLIAAAYGVQPSQVTGPEWLGHERFDIEAKFPLNTPKTELNHMLQSLLEERFALTLHTLARSEQVFLLTVDAGGPKLPPAAEPNDRSSETDFEKQKEIAARGLEEQMKNTPQNMTAAGFSSRFWPSITMADLARRLEHFTDRPVIDRTGLTGTYSVRIMVSNDTDSENTISYAVQKLGLRLVRQKVPVEAIVVDHVSKSPTPN